MNEKCPCCGQWMPNNAVEQRRITRDRLLQEFTAGKKYRAYKGKFIGEPFEEFEIILDFEKLGLVQRHTHSEEWQDTIIFTWIGLQ